MCFGYQEQVDLDYVGVGGDVDLVFFVVGIERIGVCEVEQVGVDFIEILGVLDWQIMWLYDGIR